MKLATKCLLAFGLMAMTGGVLAQDYDGSATGYGTDDNTDAGTEVENIVTVTYEVNGVEQDAEDNTDGLGDGLKFVVDRVVLINVSNMDTDNEVAVTPDEEAAYVTFDIVNDSNATLDMILDVDLDTTDFTPTNLSFWLEDGTTAGFQDDEDTELTVTGDGILLADMDEEEVARVYVVYDIPSSATAEDAEEAAVTLLAIAYENDGLGTTAVVETNTGDSNEDDPMFEDTVFGDLAGPFDDGVNSDVAEDGQHSDTGTFLIESASVTVTKSSVVVSDPFNGTTNPKAIPGAEILYCIEVTNSGGTDADNVNIKDPIPTGTTYVADSIEVFSADITCAAALVGTGVEITDDDADDAAESTTNSGISGNSGDTGAAIPEVAGTVVNTTIDTVDANDGSDDGVTATIFRVTID